jgi:MtN3 and saliva related transmembrane protein
MLSISELSITDSIIELGFSLSLIANVLLFIPQIRSLLRSKSDKGLSLVTFSGFNVIQVFTFLHAMLIKDYLLAAGNVCNIFTCGTVTYLIIYYRYKKKKS